MNSQVGGGRGRLLTSVVPWPVVMPDGVNDTAVAPGAAATLASPPAAAVLAPQQHLSSSISQLGPLDYTLRMGLQPGRIERDGTVRMGIGPMFGAPLLRPTARTQSCLVWDGPELKLSEKNILVGAQPKLWVPVASSFCIVLPRRFELRSAVVSDAGDGVSASGMLDLSPPQLDEAGDHYVWPWGIKPLYEEHIRGRLIRSISR
jgi:hypothetical protein